MTTGWQRHGWWLAAVAALALLLALALIGPDRQGVLGERVAGGPLRDVDPAAVQRIELTQAARAVVLERDGTARWRRDGQPLDDARAVRVEAGLRLLHNTPPERTLDAAQPDYGLAAPVLVLTVPVPGGAALTLAFGGVNPIGLARYVRWQRGSDVRVVLLPGDVHDTWASLVPP